MEKTKKKKSSRKLHYKDLDTLRFIGFLLVFITHIKSFFKGEIAADSSSYLDHTLTFGGVFGIEMFFTISAFLITALALREIEYHGDFKLISFYKRRSLRILPLYVVVLIIVYFAIPKAVEFLDLNYHFKLPPLLPFLTFNANFFYYVNGGDFFTGLVILWTVTVEIQFYFIWGFIIKVMKSNLKGICFFLITVGLLYRLSSGLFTEFEIFKNFHSFYNTFYYLSCFGIGALTAVHVRENKDLVDYIKSFDRSYLKYIYTGFLAYLVVAGLFYGNLIISVANAIMVPSIIGFVIIEQTFGSNSLFKLRNFKILTYLGKISYGSYMFHILVIDMFIFGIAVWQGELTGITKFMFPIVCFIITIIIAHLSYKYFEKPFLRFRREFKRQ